MKSEFVENLDGVPDFPTMTEALLASGVVVGIIGEKRSERMLYKLAFVALAVACGKAFAHRGNQFEEAYHRANPSIRANALAD